MTGFGYKEYQTEKSHYILNLKSYNNRYLDILVYIPSFLNQLEPKIREYLSKKLNRGRVEFSLKVQDFEDEVKIHLDKNNLKVYMDIFKEIIAETGISDRIGLSQILRIDGILKTQKNHDIDRYWGIIEPLLADLFTQYDTTRIEEGERTAEEILRLIEEISTNVDIIETFTPKIEIKIKEVIMKKFNELLESNIEESRMLAEIAVLMIKYDIREEVTRLKSHIKGFHDTVKAGKSVGKKLDFLCQELNREINTIGSKSLFLEVNNAVITIKDHIEAIREQLRNVE